MKKIISLLFACMLIVFSSICVNATTLDLTETGKTVVTIGDWVLEKVNKDTQWEMDQYIGDSEEVIVPWRIGDLMVISLGDYCFANNTNIICVTTTSPPWNIGDYCFIDCTSLEKVQLNNMLDYIGIGAFSGTSSLKRINLEDSVVSKIQPYTFLNSGIEEIILPNTCTEISNNAFAQCKELTKITIPKSVNTIDEEAFKFSDKVTIYCYKDSCAHMFAVEHDIPFVLLDANPYMLGDADNSGDIDVIDATFVQRYSIEALIPCEDTIMQADVDSSGDVSSIDATFILRHLIHISVGYPIGEYVS